MLILYIATLCTAKSSIVVLLRSLTPSQQHKRLGLGLGTFIAVWGITSIFATAFQCAGPRFWYFLGNKCFDRVSVTGTMSDLSLIFQAAFWRFVGVANIITNLALILLPFYIISSLQMTLSKKIVILVCFGARLMWDILPSRSPSH